MTTNIFCHDSLDDVSPIEYELFEYFQACKNLYSTGLTGNLKVQALGHLYHILVTGSEDSFRFFFIHSDLKELLGGYIIKIMSDERRLCGSSHSHMNKFLEYFLPSLSYTPSILIDVCSAVLSSALIKDEQVVFAAYSRTLFKAMVSYLLTNYEHSSIHDRLLYLCVFVCSRQSELVDSSPTIDQALKIMRIRGHLIGREHIRLLMGMCSDKNISIFESEYLRKCMSDFSKETLLLNNILLIHPVLRNFIQFLNTADHFDYFLELVGIDTWATDFKVELIRYIVRCDDSLFVKNTARRWELVYALFRSIKDIYGLAQAKLAVYYDWIFKNPHAHIESLRVGYELIFGCRQKNGMAALSLLEFLYFYSRIFDPSFDSSTNIKGVFEVLITCGFSMELNQLPVAYFGSYFENILCKRKRTVRHALKAENFSVSEDTVKLFDRLKIALKKSKEKYSKEI